MKVLLLIPFVSILFIQSYAQESEKFARKLADRICDCVGEVHTYAALQSRLDSCHRMVVNDAAINASTEELNVIGNVEQFNWVIRNLENYIKKRNPQIGKLMEEEAATGPPTIPYPTNFGKKEYKAASKGKLDWNGRIVAFDGEIVTVNALPSGKTYLEVELEHGKTMWVCSMIDSQFDKKGNVLRFMGYFDSIENEGLPRHPSNESGFHVVAFAEIDHATNQMAIMPGSEFKIREWARGRIPEVKNRYR